MSLPLRKGETSPKPAPPLKLHLVKERSAPVRGKKHESRSIPPLRIQRSLALETDVGARPLFWLQSALRVSGATPARSPRPRKTLFYFML